MRALHGVIIITTKKAYHRKFVIRDAKTLLTVSNATVEAKSVKTGKVSYFIADAYGRFETDSLKTNDYDIIVSSIGYKTSKLNLKSILNSKSEIKLEPLDQKNEMLSIAKSAFYVYPNPVSQSTSINISFSNVKSGQYQIRIISSSGQLISSFQKQVSGKGETEQIHLNGKTLPGMYIVQIIDEQKKLIQSSKIVVQ
ncbi:T9SS type A sorting domain-containing protein [Lacibacter sediminis]|uniref:T9SS type A sorting domain-containing protein n=1 Tax=Lacibacter sediminis TaxID=2760713 RepID=A0A7G5XBX9_9BACT|nr:T9SS type A sorting domain-containing protein [Lacibacter sediminis]QNA42982.1 T9SS type A sorting domain-containing protein [Lacibacter sediminis]